MASPACLFRSLQRSIRFGTQKPDIGYKKGTTSRRDNYRTDPEPISQLARHTYPVPAGGISIHRIAQTGLRSLYGKITATLTEPYESTGRWGQALAGALRDAGCFGLDLWQGSSPQKDRSPRVLRVQHSRTP